MDDMEKRGLFAIVLCLLILFSWQFFMAQKKGGSHNQPPSVKTTAEIQPGTPIVTKEKGTLASTQTSSDLPEKEMVIETPLYKAIFSTRNGGIKSWQLKTYHDRIGKDAQWVEMIHQKNPASRPLYLTLQLPGYQIQRDFNYDIKSQTPYELILVYRDRLIEIERTYRFKVDSYEFQHWVSIRPVSKKGEALFQARTGEIYVGLSEESQPLVSKGLFGAPYANQRNFLYLIHNKATRKPVVKSNENEEIKQVVEWMGIEDRYFVSVLINRSFLKPYLFITKPDSENHAIELQFPFHREPSKEAIEMAFTGYLGPKELNTLEKVDPTLEHTIDFGMFSFFCILLLKVLNFFYKFVGNYGISIILLTLLIRGLFHPLTKKSLQSMREMQRIQPEMAKIKEQFKDDKERMNKEIMELMKTHKVNPLGGCLPLLFQMPIFFALYRLLYNAIELYQAPFFGWIQDLSAKDPYYITPVLMGISMFLQQKMTPSTSMDPAQQKMLMFMPLIFSFFMISLPSGLVIYILFSTVLQVASQYVVNREFAKKQNQY